MATEIESIGLAMDTSGVERGIKSLDELAARGPKVEQSMQGVERAAKQAGQGVSTLGQGATAAGVEKVGAAGERAAQGLGKMGQAAQSAVSSQAALSRAVDGFTQTERKYIQSLLDEYNALDQTRAAKAAYIAQQKGMSQAAQEVARAVGGKIEAYKAERAELDKLSKASEMSAQSMAGIARAGVQAIVGSALLGTIKSVGQALFEASAQAERFRTTLNFATGGQGAREIEYLRRVTQELGLQFNSTAQAYSGFQAAARGTSLEGQKAKDVFESIAKASAVVGLSAEQSRGVLLALQQMMSKGTVQSEELRGQLGERLPGAFQIAAKAMGVTTAELGKMLEQGQVVADDFLPKFARALNESLGGAAEKAADRLDAAVNRFGNAWERLKQNAGDSGTSDYIGQQMNSAAGALDYVSVAMETARKNGSGFAGQMLAAASAMHDMTLVGKRTELNMYDNAKATKEAEAKLAELQKRAATEGTSAWLLKEIGQTNRYIATLQQARRERDALEGKGGSNEAPGGDPYNSGSQYGEWKKNEADRAANEKKLTEERMRAMGVSKQYNESLQVYAEALRLGNMEMPEYVKAVSDLAKRTYDASTAGKAAAKTSSERASAAKAEQSTYDKLISSIQTKIAQNEAEIAGGAKLSENQKLRIKYAEDLQGSLKGITAAQRSVIEGYLDEHKAAEQANVAAREAMKAAQEIAAARNREAAGIDAWVRAQEDAARQSLKSVQDRIHSMEDESRAIELSQALNVSLAEAIELVAIARLEEKQAGFYEGSEGWLAIQREIDARRELLGLIGSKAAREANKRAADEAAKDWERTAQTISDTLADYIMSGGKDAAQYLKRLFATLVLQPTVQTLVGGILGTGPAAAASGGSNILGLAGNANSLAGMNTGWLTNFGATLPGSIASTGAQLYSQGFEALGNGLMDFGNSIAGYADALNVAGDVLGYGSAIFAAANGKWGQAIGSAVGTYFGGPIGSFIGSTIGKWADKIFSGGAGTPHTGGAGSYSVAGGQSTGLAVLDQGLTFGVGERHYNSEAEKAAVGISQGIVQLLDSTAQSFGQQAGYFAATAFADDSSKDGAWGSLRIMRGDEKVLDWADTQTSKWAPKVFADGEQGQKEYAAAIATSARDALKTALGDATWAKDMLDTLGDSVTLEGLGTVVAQINQAKASFVSFGQYMPTFAGLAESAVSALVSASGGVAPLQANMGTFVDQFYSDAEKLAINTENVRAAMQALGLEMPATRDEFKALVQAQIALGEAGAETAASLLGLSGAFAAVTQSSEDAAAAAKQLAQEQERARQAQIDSTYDMLRRLVDRDRDLLAEQASAVQDVIIQISTSVDLLKSNARDLYGTVDSTAQMLAAQGMVYIEDALSGLRGGASITGYTGLQDAISAARSGINSGVYASQFERDRDALVLAGQLAEMAELGDVQLSVQERQLRAVNEQLEYLDTLSKRADDLVNGNIELTGTVQSNFDKLLALLDPQVDVGDTAGKSSSAFAIGGSAPGGGGSGGAPYDKAADVRNMVGLQLQLGADKGLGHEDDSVLRAINAARYGTGITQADIANAYGVPVDDIERLFAGAGIPKFDVGTNYIQRTGLAVVHEGEAIVPKPFNPWAGGQGMQGGNARLEALVQTLVEQNARLESRLAAVEGHTKKQADQFESYSNGGTFSRQKAMA